MAFNDITCKSDWSEQLAVSDNLENRRLSSPWWRELTAGPPMEKLMDGRRGRPRFLTIRPQNVGFCYRVSCIFSPKSETSVFYFMAFF